MIKKKLEELRKEFLWNIKKINREVVRITSLNNRNLKRVASLEAAQKLLKKIGVGVDLSTLTPGESYRFAVKRWTARSLAVYQFVKGEGIADEMSVIAPPGPSRGPRSLEGKKYSPPRKRGGERVVKGGDEVTLIYPSGARKPAVVKIAGDLAVIEGKVYGTAAFVVAVADLSFNLNLGEVDHIRVVHSPRGIAELRKLLDS